MPPPLLQRPASSADCLGESSSAPSTSAEHILSLQKAKSLDDHVPSLKRRRKGKGEEAPSLCLEYEEELLSPRRKCAGLLDALEHTEKSSGGAEEGEDLPGEEEAQLLPREEQRGGRKRIKLVSNAAPQPPGRREPRARAALYIAAVKEALSQHSFQAFSRALQSYKGTNDLGSLLAQMTSLFAGDAGTHALLRDFYQFVRPQHKQQFHEACCSLTGLGCGYKPEHSLLQEEREMLAKDRGRRCRRRGAAAFSEDSCAQLDPGLHRNQGEFHLAAGLQSAGQAAAGAPKDPEKASSSRRDHQEGLRSAYLRDVKRALTPSSYSQFTEALLAYKRTDNYAAMIPVIAALTTERPEDFHLLHRFCMFVRPQHRDSFRQLCRDLAGAEEQQSQQHLPGEGSAQSSGSWGLKKEEQSPVQGRE